MVRIHSPRPIPSITWRDWTTKQPTQFQSCRRIRSLLYCGHGGSAARAQAPLHIANPRYILNHMVQYTGTVLDASFAVLSDATRRGVLEQLGRADASITDLAEKFHMTLTGMKKHVGVLEQAGLVTTEKVGRVRT